MVSGPDKSNELSVLTNNNESIATDSPQDIWRIDCTIRVFKLFSAWITHGHTP